MFCSDLVRGLNCCCVHRVGSAPARCLFWMSTALGTGWEDAIDICVILATYWRGRMPGTWLTRRCCTTASRFVPPMFTATGTSLHKDTLRYWDFRWWERYNHGSRVNESAELRALCKSSAYFCTFALAFIIFFPVDVLYNFAKFCLICCVFCSQSFFISFPLSKPQQYSFSHYTFHSPFFVILISKSHCVAHSLHVPDSQRGSELQGAGSKSGGKKESKKKRKCKTQLALESAR